MIPRMFLNKEPTQFNQNPSQLDYVEIPKIPPQIHFKSLHKNKDGIYCLLDDNQIKQLLNLNLPDGKYTKNKAPIKDIPYNIISIEEELYIIYPTVIGKGAFGEVRVAQSLRSGEWYVEKRITLDEEALKSKNKSVEQALKEIEDEHHILMRLGFSQTLFSEQKFGKRKSKSKGTQYLMLMKYANGVPLSDLIENETYRGEGELFLTDPLLASETRLAIVGSILREARRIIDVKNIIHADIKPENIIIDINNLLASYIDYGMAFRVDKNGKQYKTKIPVGTMLYLPNEILVDLHKIVHENASDVELSYDEKSMVYALGVTIARLFNLYFTSDFYRDSISFNTKINQDLLANPVDQNPYIDLYNYNDSIEEEFRKQLIDLLNGMLQKDAHKRYSLMEAISQFQQIKDAYFIKHSKDNIVVSVVNVEDYIKLDEPKKIEFLKKLKMSEVWLIDTGKPKDMTVYMAVRSDVENLFHRIRAQEKIDHIETPEMIIPLVAGDKVFFGETVKVAKHKLQCYLRDRLSEDYSRNLTPASSKEIIPSNTKGF